MVDRPVFHAASRSSCATLRRKVAVFDRLDGDDGELVLDARFFPLAIATWLGGTRSSHSDPFFGWLDQQLDRARQEGTKIALVLDLLDVRAQPERRRRYVDEVNARAASLSRWHVGTVLAAQGPLMLGVISSIVQQFEVPLRVSTVGQTSKALGRALECLDMRGEGRRSPLVVEDYGRPQRSGAGAA